MSDQHPEQERATMEELGEVLPPEEMPADVPPTADGGRNRMRTVGLVLVVLVVVLVVTTVVYGLATQPVLTARLRDISIIALALVTMVTSIFLAILVFQLQSLIVLLRDEIQPILKSVNDTAGTVRGTTAFVSDAVVSPMIQIAGYASAVRQTLKALAGGSGQRKRSQDRTKSESESTRSS